MGPRTGNTTFLLEQVGQYPGKSCRRVVVAWEVVVWVPATRKFWAAVLDERSYVLALISFCSLLWCVTGNTGCILWEVSGGGTGALRLRVDGGGGARGRYNCQFRTGMDKNVF